MAWGERSLYTLALSLLVRPTAIFSLAVTMVVAIVHRRQASRGVAVSQCPLDD